MPEKLYNDNMVKKTSTATKKKAAAAKKPVKSVKKSTAKKASVKRVDIYPNRMTVAVSALAGTLLVLVTIIAVLGSRG